MITQEILKEFIYYNPDTGIFTWKRYRNRQARREGVAGSVSKKGYIRIKINGRLYMAHRLAFLYTIGRFPVDQTDHINGIRNDNKWINLREATGLENTKNMKIYRTNKSGCQGVRWDKDRNKWRAGIRVCTKGIYLGLYTDKFEAICARKSAELKYNFHPNHGKVL